MTQQTPNVPEMGLRDGARSAFREVARAAVGGVVGGFVGLGVATLTGASPDATGFIVTGLSAAGGSAFASHGRNAPHNQSPEQVSTVNHFPGR